MESQFPTAFRTHPSVSMSPRVCLLFWPGLKHTVLLLGFLALVSMAHHSLRWLPHRFLPCAPAACPNISLGDFLIGVSLVHPSHVQELLPTSWTQDLGFILINQLIKGVVSQHPTDSFSEAGWFSQGWEQCGLLVHSATFLSKWVVCFFFLFFCLF